MLPLIEFVSQITIVFLKLIIQLFFILLWGWDGTKSTITGLLYQPWAIDGDNCGRISRMDECQGNPKYSQKTCPSAALSTTNLT
jgi:hypothetical protein